MTAAELTPEIRAMRVAVCRDVLKQLDRKDVPLRIRAGSYLEGMIPKTISRDDDLRDHADEFQRGCHACLLGACMLSKARLYDGVPLAELTRYWEDRQDGLAQVGAGDVFTRRSLDDVFDRATMALMEAAFELELIDSSNLISDEDARSATAFGRESTPQNLSSGIQKGAPDRVRAVMEDVIENDGVFTAGGGLS